MTGGLYQGRRNPIDSHNPTTLPAEELQYGRGHYLDLRLEVFYLCEALGKCALAMGAIPYLGARHALAARIGVNGEFEQCYRIGSNQLNLSILRWFLYTDHHTPILHTPPFAKGYS